MALKKTGLFDWEYLLAAMPRRKTFLESKPKHCIYMQGDPADSVFFLQLGKVKLSVMSNCVFR